ncbi:MAG: hypothetical protein FWF10_00670 [Clostridiales bacterium]|nr:hypothetical protein [Clostridiales bacterium]
MLVIVAILGALFGVALALTIWAITRKRGKPEFSKILATWAVVIATLSVVASYVLAAFGLDPIQDLTLGIFSVCVGDLVGYSAKSLMEKMSRNKHGLDAGGRPYGDDNGE